MRLAYRVDGPETAPLLVLSGALGTSTAMWEPQLAALATRFRVLRHDHPGHGASPPPDGQVTIAEIARSVVALLDELGVRRAAFCGLSLGGMVGQWLGANEPERIDGLVLACTGAKLGTQELYEERAALVRAEGTQATLEGARERWFTPEFRDSEPARAILDELLRTPAEAYAACAEAVGAFDFRGELGRISAPTLVVYGEDDPVTPSDAVDELAGGIPGATRAGLANAAHLASVEQPEAFAAAVLSHLTERAAA